MARQGNEFIQEMIQYVATLEKETSLQEKNDRIVQLISFPYFGSSVFYASPAQFGIDINGSPLAAKMAKAMPFRACSSILNSNEIQGKIAIVERADCMFQEKARNVQLAGAVGMLVIDHEPGTKHSDEKLSFAMAGDKETGDDIAIPALFVYRVEGEFILSALKKYPNTVILMTSSKLSTTQLISDFLKSGQDKKADPQLQCTLDEGEFLVFDANVPVVIFNLRLDNVHQESEPAAHQEIVERHVTEFQKFLTFEDDQKAFKFYEFFRNVAYGALGLNVEDSTLENAKIALSSLEKHHVPSSVYQRLHGNITHVRCVPRENRMICTRLAF